MFDGSNPRRVLLGVAVLLVVNVAGWTIRAVVKDNIRIDRCLDGGGRLNDEDQACESDGE